MSTATLAGTPAHDSTLDPAFAPLAAALTARLSGSSPDGLAATRRAAFEQFRHDGFPTVRDERWRFTRVASVAQTAWHDAAVATVSPADVARLSYPGCRTLVFVNGRHVAALSSPGEQSKGLVIGSLAALLTDNDANNGSDPDLAARLRAALGSEASPVTHPFVALNTALFADGAAIVVPRGRVVSEPIHLLFLAVPSGEANAPPVAIHPRVLVLAEERGEATLIESHVGLTTSDGTSPGAAARYLSTAVTEVVTGPGSVIDLVKIQQESLDAAHLSTIASRHERASTFRLHSISFGGGLVRNEVQANLAAEGVEAVLNGLYLVRGRQHVDHQMRVEHAAPHCNSHELFKGILEDQARAVFNGLIHVHKGAQKTDAKQTNRNLLLSKNAVANSNPQLRIFADDVKCTHGSTIGQLDPTAVFYLRSRGIGLEAATSLLTYAFAHEVIEGIRLEAVRTDLEEFLFQRLPKGEVVRQAV